MILACPESRIGLPRQAGISAESEADQSVLSDHRLLWFTFLNHRRGRSGNIVIGILIPRSGQPVRIERRRQRTADDPSKESPTRCAMKAIDNVYGQRAYNLLSRNTSASRGLWSRRLRVRYWHGGSQHLTRDSATSNPQFRSDDGSLGSCVTSSDQYRQNAPCVDLIWWEFYWMVGTRNECWYCPVRMRESR